MKQKKVQKDHVDRILDQWQQELPDLSTEAMGLFGRLHRLSQLLFKHVHLPLAEKQGLTTQDFDVMAALYRSGRPYQHAPGELLATMMITSGTMTNRIDRLVQTGFVSRQTDPDDRRSVKLQLTADGLKKIQSALKAHIESEEEAAHALTPEERRELTRLMKKWLLALEEAE